MDHKELIEIGFSEKEAKVYLELHKHSALPVSTLARYTQIKRTTLYDVINSLMNKNLISSFQQGRSMYYTIDDVNKLLLFQKDRMNSTQSVIEKLKSKPQFPHGTHVSYYRGVEGYRQMYRDVFESQPREICSWMHLDNFWSGLDPVEEEQWTQKRVKRKIHARLLLQDTPVAREFQKQDADRFRETRLLGKQFSFNPTCFLYKDHIIYFYHHENEFVGVKIFHPEFYQLQKQIFEMNWQLVNQGVT